MVIEVKKFDPPKIAFLDRASGFVLASSNSGYESVTLMKI